MEGDWKEKRMLQPKESSRQRRFRKQRADMRFFSRLVSASQAVVMHHTSGTALAHFLRAYYLRHRADGSFTTPHGQHAGPAGSTKRRVVSPPPPPQRQACNIAGAQQMGGCPSVLVCTGASSPQLRPSVRVPTPLPPPRPVVAAALSGYAASVKAPLQARTLRPSEGSHLVAPRPQCQFVPLALSSASVPRVSALTALLPSTQMLASILAPTLAHSISQREGLCQQILQATPLVGGQSGHVPLAGELVSNYERPLVGPLARGAAASRPRTSHKASAPPRPVRAMTPFGGPASGSVVSSRPPVVASLVACVDRSTSSTPPCGSPCATYLSPVDSQMQAAHSCTEQIPHAPEPAMREEAICAPSDATPYLHPHDEVLKDAEGIPCLLVQEEITNVPEGMVCHHQHLPDSMQAHNRATIGRLERELAWAQEKIKNLGAMLKAVQDASEEKMQLMTSR